MATFTITIPQELVSEITEAYCDYYSYNAYIETEGGIIENPETKAAFTKRMMRESVVSIVKSYRVGSLEATRATIIEDTETDCENITVS